MGWPLRMQEQTLIYFVTVRCAQSRLLLRPSQKTNDVVGGVLARAVERSAVELFGFSFASNHVHMKTPAAIPCPAYPISKILWKLEETLQPPHPVEP